MFFVNTALQATCVGIYLKSIRGQQSVNTTRIISSHVQPARALRLKTLLQLQIIDRMSHTTGSRKVAIAVDLSDESAYAVRWAVANYLRPDDSVILLHVQPTSILYGADWGAMDQSIDTSDEESQQQLESSFDTFTSNKAADLSKPILDAKIPFKIHIVKDHDMKERVCLEVERLGVNAVIMGSRGFGAVKKAYKARLGSVSDYCVHHCDCPVVVVRYPEEGREGGDLDLENHIQEGTEGFEVYHDAPADEFLHNKDVNGGTQTFSKTPDLL